MTRPMGDGEGNGRADEDFDRIAGGALKEQADALFFGDLSFDERLRAAIRTHAAEGLTDPAGGGGEGRAGTRRWPGRWAYLATIPAVAAVLLLAFRLGSPTAGWKDTGRFAQEAASSQAAPASLEKRALSDEEAPPNVLRPANLPPGTVLDDVRYYPSSIMQTYRLSGGVILKIAQNEGGLPDRDDPAHPANRGAERVAVNGAEGWLIRSRPSSADTGGSATLSWQQDRFALVIIWSVWDVPLEELLRVAVSLR